MIRNIIFDGSGVITDEKPKETTLRWSKRFGITSDKIWDVVYVQNYDLAYVGKLTAQEYYKKSVAELSMNISYDEFARDYIADCSVRPEMIILLKKLAKNYPLYLLSNQTPINTGYLHPILDPFFKAIFFSNEVKMHKPSLQIYELLIKKTNINPRETIFIDDRELNLLPAEKLGMKTYKFNSTDSLLEMLQKFGIKW